MKPRLWDESELEVIRREYADADIGELAERLNRTRSAVRIMGYKLGLKNNRQYTNNFFKVNKEKQEHKDGESNEIRMLEERIVAINDEMMHTTDLHRLEELNRQRSILSCKVSKDAVQNLSVTNDLYRY